jgi:hypothetical protein
MIELMLLLLATLVVPSWAEKEAQSLTPQQYINQNFPGGGTPAPKPMAPVRKQLHCIRNKGEKKLDLITHDAAAAIIDKISPHLAKAFEKYKFSPMERALFYSQVIEESGGFTSLTESNNYGNPAGDGIGNVINATLSDPHFKAKKGATRSKQFGDFRGRGLIQVSRCDNYFSVLHYMRQMREGKTAVWKADWKYPSGKSSKTVGTVCTPADIAGMKAANPGIDPYGVLDNPVKMAMLDGEFRDNNGANPIPSEQFLAEASVAFWRGNCGDTSANASDRTKLEALARCKEYAGGEYSAHASKCMTKCVKGVTEGWEKRERWLKVAMSCLNPPK